MLISFKKWLESIGSPYIGPCINTKDYQVWGACSDQNSEETNKKIRNGERNKKEKK
jgi:hypothetical protein